MRRLFVGALSCAAAGVFSAPAGAADLRMPVNAPPMATAFDWTGFYAGVNAGYVWGNSDVVSAIDPTSINRQALSTAASPSLDPGGATGGVQAGYNFQMNSLIFGLEADFNAFALRDSSAVSQAYPVGGGGFSVNTKVSADWLLTVRPRIGYAAGAFLIYGTGGLAATKLKHELQFSDSFGFFDHTNASKTRIGWTAGLGFEYAYSTRWTLKAEYLHTDFGSLSLAPRFLNSAVTTFRHSVPLTANVVRVGLNYRF